MSSLERLQHTLDVDYDVAIALLRILDGVDVPMEQLVKELAQSAALYHSVTDDLAGIVLNDSYAQRLVAEAYAGMLSGSFGYAEIQMRQLEDHEVASVDNTTDSATSAASISAQPRLMAARVRTLLGKVALMNLRYGQATEDFEMARQRITMPPTVQTTVASATPATRTDARQSERQSAPPPQLDGDWSQHIAFVPQQPATDALRKDTPDPIMTVMVRPAMQAPPAQEAPKQASQSPIANAAVSVPVVLRSFSRDMMALLLRRGDAMFALGDVTAARLLYQRAAEAGDARGASGTAKTYDPRVLAQIGALGIRPDPAAAAVWYRKALELGDSSAAASLRLLSQASSQ